MSRIRGVGLKFNEIHWYGIRGRVACCDNNLITGELNEAVSVSE